ncbi:MAG: flagellar hook-basal body complex protein [Nitrospinae bacterium]|nr:flagellar hook-basal body complex protein [Nitrospinota bacterium]
MVPSPITIFNSVGSEIALEIEFNKTGPNAWDYIISVPPGDGTINLANLNNSGSVEFDANGILTVVNGGLVNPEFFITYASATPPAADQTITWNLLDGTVSNGFLTGFASISSNNSLVQDGFPSGSLTGLTVDSDGIINGMFSNGQTEGLFQIALANFLSPTGLTREGSNLFSATVASGEAIIGTANTGSRGEILGSVLELSNVDLVTEFISLIRTQRAFQASARVVTTADELLNEVINIMRGNSRV